MWSVNDLVESTEGKFAGIGCVAKVLKASVRVKVVVDAGPLSLKTIRNDKLRAVDTEGCPTLDFAEFKRLNIANSPKLPENVIIGNELKHYVGIGWTTTRAATHADLKKYPRII